MKYDVFAESRTVTAVILPNLANYFTMTMFLQLWTMCLSLVTFSPLMPLNRPPDDGNRASNDPERSPKALSAQVAKEKTDWKYHVLVQKK